MRIKLFIYVIIIQFNFKYHNLFDLCAFSHHRIVIELIGNNLFFSKKRRIALHIVLKHMIYSYIVG